MATHRAVVLSSIDKPISIEDVPRPIANTGEAVVRVLATSFASYMKDIMNGSRQYPLSFPITPGSSAIARIEEVGPDAVSLVPGQLVWCDITVHGRDDPNVQFLLGVHGGQTPATRKLMDGPWRNSTFAELAKFPLENVYPLNEEVLVKQRGYSFADLCYLSPCMVAYGGLSEIDVKAGEVVIVAPATGKFSGAAVSTALAMGATVVAAGRNQRALDALRSIYGRTGRINTVNLTGEEAKDSDTFRSLTPSGRGADAYIDFSPPQAANSTHIAAGIKAVRPYGRVALMGGIVGSISIPYGYVMHLNIRLQGRFMYDRAQILQVVRLAEMGNLRMGKDVVETIGPYGLGEMQKALDETAERSAWGSHVVLQPN